MDADHVYMECSNCRKKLADILITNPDLDQTWQVEVNCPFCGDKSYRKTIKGSFAPAGYFIQEEPEEGEAGIAVYCFTDLDDIITDQKLGLVKIKVKKAQKGS